MSITKWSPTDPFEELEKALRNFQLPMEHTFVPSMDIYTKKGMVVVKAPIADFDPDNVDISIERNMLTIKGKTEKKSEVDEKSYFRKEIKSGSFQRSVLLPAEVEDDKATAAYADGVLTISIPVKKESGKKSKRVKIAVKGFSKKK